MAKINDNCPLNADQIRELKSEAARTLNVDLTTAEEEVSGIKLVVFQVKASDDQVAETQRRAVNLFMFSYCKKHDWPASFAVDSTVIPEMAVKEG